LQWKIFPRHLVGHDEHDAIALAGADQSEPQAGIAGSGLDDRAAGFQPAVGFRRLDYRPRRAVLDGARRVGALKFQEQPARAAVEAGDFDERSLADQIED
jgi:hypothetical protein